MKLIIAGSRDYDNYMELITHADEILQDQTNITIITGGAKGADELAEVYAKSRKYKLETYIPEWFRNGKAAGPIRNRLMAEKGDYLLALWNGESKGTWSMIMEAKRAKLPMTIKVSHATNLIIIE